MKKRVALPILTHEERVGTLLAGKYRLESILGRGGMGAVFAGRHERTGRRVAIKLLNYEYAQHDEMADRFLSEARAAGTLSHPNVVDVLDMDKDVDGTVYLVLELLEGQTLAALLQERGRLEPTRTYELLMPVMRALSYAHRKGIIHRDLKPDNIFISEDPEHGTVPKLLDFGIAKMLDAEPSASTRSGLVVGTAEYMSPEQARGVADIGAGTDIWSMGVLWYECLTGDVPFEGANATGVILAIVDGTHARPDQKVPGLPRPIVDVVERALQVDRSARFADMAAFLEAMDTARKGFIASVLPPPSADVSASMPRILPLASMPVPPVDITGSLPRVDATASILPPPSAAAMRMPGTDPDITLTTERTSSSTALHWTDSQSTPRRGRAVVLGLVGMLALVGGVGFALTLFHHGVAAPVEAGSPVASRAAVREAAIAPPVVPPPVVPPPAVAVPVLAPPVVAAPVVPVAAPVVAAMPAVDPVLAPVNSRGGGRRSPRHAPMRAAHGPAETPALAPPPAPANPQPAAHPAHPRAPAGNPTVPLTDYELGS